MGLPGAARHVGMLTAVPPAQCSGTCRSCDQPPERGRLAWYAPQSSTPKGRPPIIGLTTCTDRSSWTPGTTERCQQFVRVSLLSLLFLVKFGCVCVHVHSCHTHRHMCLRTRGLRKDAQERRKRTYPCGVSKPEAKSGETLRAPLHAHSLCGQRLELCPSHWGRLPIPWGRLIMHACTHDPP